MLPEATALDTSGSALVDSVTFPPAVGASPVRRPVNVIAAAALAATKPLEIVKTMVRSVLPATAHATPLTFALVGALAKKFGG